MKKAVGIIAEYNPFHNGHAYQIEKAKELTQADYAVIIMSGDFVQRGTPAILPKHDRTKMALLGGADIVLELPSYYACSSAEFFAKGAVGILNALSCIDFLCFGSESGDISQCLSLARILSEEPAVYQKTLKQYLKKGISFPAARKAALLEYSKNCSCDFDADFLETPNNILGIEYCKALLSLNSSITPVTVERKGNAYHETDLSHPLSSASAIRKSLLNSKEDLKLIQDTLYHTLPVSVLNYMHKILLSEPLITEDDFSLLLKYQLMQNSSETLCQYADISPELAKRIYNHLNSFMSFSQFAERLKTKELTHTRINRALLHTLLGITDSMPALFPAYVRLLGFRKESSSFLRVLQDNTEIPVITKAADYKKALTPAAASAFEKDLFTSNLYESVKSTKKQAAFVNDLQKPPVIL